MTMSSAKRRCDRNFPSTRMPFWSQSGALYHQRTLNLSNTITFGAFTIFTLANAELPLLIRCLSCFSFDKADCIE
ncbi:hypothetical protein KIN20_004826 [Parelaphostrongylus tenuis]|uniref:Uncharacterized protein n=1 Tax=Parelaphostrongylus tenuis TaxID=148309 RepID=A0AAD5MI00_PARTN|nr:hypothetical protein KIN20_004826 [Parelaphostrongylus tenuis]